MDPDARLAALVELVLALTKSGKVRWAADEQDESIFWLDRDGGTLVIESVDGDGVKPFRLAVVKGRDSNAILESVEQTYTGSVWDKPILADLHASARRSALNVDSVMDALMAELTSLSPDDDR